MVRLTARLLHASLALLALACASEPPPPADEAPVIAAYRMYAADDCHGVRDEAQRGRAAGLPPQIARYFDLLEGYCLERAGDVAGAQKLYTELAGAAPDSVQGYDAAQRVRDLERLASERTTRAERKALAETRAPNPSVRPIRRTKPKYPRAAEAAGLTGWVLVDFAVSKLGIARDAVVLDSSPPFVFDVAALTALHQWRYEPPKSVEDPRTAVVIRFELADSAAGKK